MAVRSVHYADTKGISACVFAFVLWFRFRHQHRVHTGTYRPFNSGQCTKSCFPIDWHLSSYMIDNTIFDCRSEHQPASEQLLVAGPEPLKLEQPCACSGLCQTCILISHLVHTHTTRQLGSQPSILTMCLGLRAVGFRAQHEAALLLGAIGARLSFAEV